MKTLTLKKDLFWNGVLNPDLKVFDIIMNTEFGTTYNSYVLKGSEKTALFETAKLEFWEEYEASLKELGVLNSIDYIVVNHTEPDHAGSIAKILAHNPGATVVATGTAVSFLKEVGNTDFFSLTVEDGDTLSLGSKTLEFMVLPNLHWPDTMYTYVREDKVLFTCDSFGSHYSFDKVLRSEVTDFEGYMRATKYYFDNIIGPFANPYMVDALERLEPMDIEMICTGHGPVHDSHIEDIINTYKEWCNYDAAMEKRAQKGDENDRKLVVIPYVSAYGYTGDLADRIAEGVKAFGNVDVETYDMVYADAGEVGARLGAADGILLGTPTIIGEALAPIWQLTLGMFAPVHGGKTAGAFGSYGWSGEGVPHITERLRQLNMDVVEGFTVRLKPSEKDFENAFDFGYSFAARMCQRKERTQAAAGGLRKCMVCGEIMDASVTVCPVCGVSEEKFVPVEDTSTSFRRDTEETFLILGGGPAALAAAKAIRERNETAKIKMISKEEYLPYNRPMLTKALLSDFSGDLLAVEPEAWFEEHRVEWLAGREVTAVNTDKKTVTAGGEILAYDKLIYALGARCFVPPIKGADQSHVFTVREIADTVRIASSLKNTKEVVCIGGGVMGLEGAWEMKKGGFDVTVLEMAPGLLPKQLDEKGSAVLEDVVVKAGVNVETGVQIAEITENAVILGDGRSFPAQTVILSTGMRPNTAVAEAAGISVDAFVSVNKEMGTNAEDVYACGDCVAVDGVPQAFWSQALETGRIAGANAAGETLSYAGISSSMTIHAFGTEIFALGSNGKDGEERRFAEVWDRRLQAYEKYYFRHGVLDGVILIGNVDKMVSLTEAIEDGWSYEDTMAMVFAKQ